MTEDLAEQTADVRGRRLRAHLSRLRVLLQHIRQRRVAGTLRGCLRVTTRQGGQNDRSEDHEQFLRLIRVQSRRLLHTLLNGVLVLPENLAEQPPAAVSRRADHAAETSKKSAGACAPEHPANVVEEAPVRPQQRLDRRRTSRLIGRARHTADHHRNRRLNGTLRRRRVDAELLADLLKLFRTEMLLHEIDETHGLLEDWGETSYRTHEAT